MGTTSVGPGAFLTQPEADNLAKVFDRNGLFTRHWSTVPPMPCGGGTEALTVTSRNRQVTLSGVFVEEQRPLAQEIYPAIRLSVPAAIRAEFETRRQEHTDSLRAQGDN